MSLLLGILDIYTWVIIIRALASWVSPDPRNPIMQLLLKLTEPVLSPLRSIVPPRALGGLDVSPILAIVLIHLVKRLLLSVAF